MLYTISISSVTKRKWNVTNLRLKGLRRISVHPSSRKFKCHMTHFKRAHIFGAHFKNKSCSSKSNHRNSSVDLDSKMPYTKITDVDKQRIVDSYENYGNDEETARVLGINRHTAYAITRRYRRYGVLSKPCNTPHNTQHQTEWWNGWSSNCDCGKELWVHSTTGKRWTLSSSSQLASYMWQYNYNCIKC